MTSYGGASPPPIELLVRLARECPAPSGYHLPGGANELRSFAERTGVALPSELLAWLMVVDGAMIGPGGLFGVSAQGGSLSIEGYLRLFPSWIHRGWVPIAGNGLGDYWVTVPDAADRLDAAVAFVDVHHNPDAIDHYSASDVLRFLRFLLKSELGENRWPRDSTYVVSEDPDMLLLPEDFMPWGRHYGL